MKNLKAVLFTAIAALGLSACDMQETYQQLMDKTGGAFSNVGDFFTETIPGFVGLKDKEPTEEAPCNHQDANHDGICDLCGETGLDIVHVDDNKDHKCDVCGATISECADANNDHLCDVCGKKLSDCKDADNDFKCDDCGKELEVKDVRLDTTDAILAFALGDDFTADGVKVIATSEVGSEKELDYIVTEPDMATTGEKTVVLTFNKNGEEATLEYKINVEYWTEEDLEVFGVGSLTGYAELPYLPGYGMKVDYVVEDNVLVDWAIVADGIDAEGFNEYYNALLAYNKVAKLSGTEVYFQLEEVEAQIEGIYGLSDCAAFRLTPYAYDDSGYANRCFTNDEYFVLGIDTDGRLVVKNRFVNAMIDGYFLGTYAADGQYGFPAPYGKYIQYVADLPGYYFSEFAADMFVMPDFSASSTASFTPLSYKSMYPFAESLDAYDLAMQLYCEGATQEEFDAFTAALVTAGYETDGVAGEYGEIVYTFASKYVGAIEYTVYPFEADGGVLAFDLFYIAPEEYVTYWTPYVEEIVANAGGYLANAEVSTDYYDYGYLFVEAYYAAEGEYDAEAVANAIANGVVTGAGYELRNAATYDSSYDCYSAIISNNVVDVEIDTYADAEEDGTYYIGVILYEAVPTTTEFTPYIEAMETAFGANGENYNTDNSYYESYETVIFTFDYVGAVGEGEDAGYVAVETVLTGMDYVVFEEAEYNDSYEQYCSVLHNDDIAIELYVDGEADGGAYGVEMYLSAYEAPATDLTAEDAMVGFLAAWYECEENEIVKGTDYVEQDDKFNTTICVGTTYGVEYAEFLTGYAAGYLPGEFTKDTENCEATAEGFFATYVDETNGLVAEFTSYVDATYGLCADVSIYAMPGETLTVEGVMQDACAAVFGVANPTLGTHYMSDGQGGFYTNASFSNYTDETYLQPIAEYVESLVVPAEFARYQAGATTISSGTINAYIIMDYNATAGIVVQIMTYVHPTAGYVVAQISVYSAN